MTVEWQEGLPQPLRPLRSFPDFITVKVRSVNAQIRATLERSGHATPRIVYGWGGDERGVPLDADLAGQRRFDFALQRLRVLQPDWVVLTGSTWTVLPGRTATSEVLFVLGSNPVRSVGMLTPFSRREGGLEWGVAEILDSVAGTLSLTHSLSFVYAPSAS